MKELTWEEFDKQLAVYQRSKNNCEHCKMRLSTNFLVGKSLCDECTLVLLKVSRQNVVKLVPDYFKK